NTGGFSAHQYLLGGIALFTIVLFTVMARKVKTDPPKKSLFGLLEFTMVWIRDEIVYPWLGPERGRKMLGFFWTLFFFILFSNIVGLAPFPFNPWDRTATGNLAVTGALALIVFVVVQGAGMKQKGLVGYWVHLVPPGTPIFLWPLVWIIEFIGLFTKPFALTVRLFANMTGGHAILLVLFGFLYFVPHANKGVIGIPSTIAAFGFILFIMLFEVLVALIQAYIFTVLSAIFTSLAVAEEH
ncbi:MAG: F-type H+-transporting ATPase subunit a, partial [Rhodospirillaceae bacterium]|nr:F-type H+-transporting ATPase subunit a [Rhodospirillaceae bacterium]